MVKKIKIVNLTDDNLNETEAMSKIVEEMKNEALIENENETPLEPTEPVIMKKKTKAKNHLWGLPPDEVVVNFDSYKTIKPIQDVEIEVKPVEVEPIEVRELPAEVRELPAEVENKNIKTTELVKCEDCGKMMTLKSLKYSHKNNCSVNKKEIIAEVVPEIIPEIVAEKKPKKVKAEKISEPRPEKLNTRNERLMNRIRKIEDLALQAF